MLNSSIFNSNSFSIIQRVVVFTTSLAIMYGIVIMGLSNAKVDGLSLLHISAGNYAVTGDVRGTLQRFRGIENAGEVDVLFVGSSHSYASFDSRVFSESGLTSYNLGTPSQTPLNTYYLLQSHLSRLNPKLVIYEIYHHNLASDGLESFYDLIANQAPSTELFSMALATKNPHALNSFSAKLINSSMGSDEEALQLSSPHLTYMKGGFLAHNSQLEDTLFGEPEVIITNETQWEYVQEILEMALSSGTELLVVITPMPEGAVNRLTNYAEISEKIANLCDGASVKLYNFNATPTLRPTENYADYHHLNATGAKLFSSMIMDSLRVTKTFANRLSLTPEVASR